MAGGQGRQDHERKDAQRREPAGARRQADPGLRCMGALLLYRLPQPAPGLPQGFHGQSRELGPRGQNVRCRHEMTSIFPRSLRGA